MIYCCFSRRTGATSNVWRVFTTFVISLLTSCRHHWDSTWVTKALQHWITDQCYQHDFATEIFALIKDKTFAPFETEEKKQGWGRLREKKFNYEENSRKICFSVSWFFFSTVLKRMWTRRRNKMNCAKNSVAKPFLMWVQKGLFPFHFVLHSFDSWIMRSGNIFFFINNLHNYTYMMSVLSSTECREKLLQSIFFWWSSKILYFFSFIQQLDNFRKGKATRKQLQW